MTTNGTLVGPLDPTAVKVEIEKAIALHRTRFENLRAAPTLPGETDKAREDRLAQGQRFMETQIDREHTFYSYAAIYKTANGQFRLVYDPTVIGTGEFSTFDEAVEWFVKGGR